MNCPTHINATSTIVQLPSDLTFHTNSASNLNGTLSLNVVSEPLITPGSIFFTLSSLPFTVGSNGSRYISTPLTVGNVNQTLQYVYITLEPGNSILYAEVVFGVENSECAITISVPNVVLATSNADPIPTIGEELWKILSGFAWWVYLVVFGSMLTSLLLTCHYYRKLTKMREDEKRALSGSSHVYTSVAQNSDQS